MQFDFFKFNLVYVYFYKYLVSTYLCFVISYLIKARLLLIILLFHTLYIYIVFLSQSCTNIKYFFNLNIVLYF